MPAIIRPLDKMSTMLSVSCWVSRSPLNQPSHGTLKSGNSAASYTEMIVPCAPCSHPPILLGCNQSCEAV